MRDQNGESAILKAVYHGQQDDVTALLASGVELDILSTPTHPTFTPLGLATYFGHADTVDALLAAGAEAAIAYAEERNHAEMVQFLKQRT